MKLYEQYQKEISFIESIANIEKQKNYMSDQKNPEIYIKRLKYFLKVLGNPQNKVKNYIHIGGTSGKGSVANFIHNILVSSGKKSGLFTSPFVTETIEKYKMGDRFISPREFIKIVNDIKPALDKCDENSPYGIPSYFEICYVIALIYFTKNNCQYFVSEVGCGGEFDATNIVSKSKLSIITHVDFDHTEMLGNTLAKIAKTKSKIIKPKSIFLTCERRTHIRNIFARECKNKKTTYMQISPKIKKAVHKNNKFIFNYQDHEYKMQLWGQHQTHNAILAIETAKLLKIKQKFITRGIENTKIPGRFEIIQKRPYIVLDVAHNPDKIRTTIDNLGLLNYRKLHIVYASAANKDLSTIARQFAPFADNFYATKFFIQLRKCADPKMLCKLWIKYNQNLKTFISLDPYLAIDTAIKKSNANDCILIVGSFFLVGEIRKKWFPSLKILRSRKVI